jgi:hypothetical protein
MLKSIGDNGSPWLNPFFSSGNIYQLTFMVTLPQKMALLVRARHSSENPFIRNVC